MDYTLLGCNDRGHLHQKVTNFDRKIEIAFCSTSPHTLSTVWVAQQIKADSENSAYPRTASTAQDSLDGLKETQELLSKPELALINELFELLAKWEHEAGPRGN
jgi:hypothetical protein